MKILAHGSKVVYFTCRQSNDTNDDRTDEHEINALTITVPIVVWGPQRQRAGRDCFVVAVVASSFVERTTALCAVSVCLLGVRITIITFRNFCPFNCTAESVANLDIVSGLRRICVAIISIFWRHFEAAFVALIVRFGTANL